MRDLKWLQVYTIQQMNTKSKLKQSQLKTIMRIRSKNSSKINSRCYCGNEASSAAVIWFSQSRHGVACSHRSGTFKSTFIPRQGIRRSRTSKLRFRPSTKVKGTKSVQSGFQASTSRRAGSLPPFRHFLNEFIVVSGRPRPYEMARFRPSTTTTVCMLCGMYMCVLMRWKKKTRPYQGGVV